MMHPAMGADADVFMWLLGVSGDRGIVVDMVKHAHSKDSALRCKSVPIG